MASGTENGGYVASWRQIENNHSLQKGRIDMEEKEKLLNNIKELINQEANEVLIMGALFYKLETKIKSDLINGFKDNINNLVIAYQLNKSKYENEINDMINSYEDVVNNIANLYEVQYANIQETLIQKQAAQKEAIAKIIEIKVLCDVFRANKDKENLLKMKDILKKRIEEKLNYDVLVDHCERKLEKCLVDMQISLKSIAVKQEFVLDHEQVPFITTLKYFIKKLFIRHSFNKDIKVKQDSFLKHVIKEEKDTELFIGYNINQFNLQLQRVQADLDAAAE